MIQMISHLKTKQNRNRKNNSEMKIISSEEAYRTMPYIMKNISKKNNK